MPQLSQIQTFNVPLLKVGIISDSQITPCFYKHDTIYERNLIDALTTLKANGCTLIIFAGDICNMPTSSAYQKYLNCFKKVFKNDMPIIQHIMGNHDHIFYPEFTHLSHKLFEKNLNQNPLTHYVINGYHFIGMSAYNSSMTDGYSNILDWAEEQLSIASKDDPNKPIFVTTHNSPKNTVYGSDNWGDIKLGALFEKYPNVINFSGHLHYSLLCERSFYQGTYYALATQSVSYLELESGKLNGTMPSLCHDYPMGYIIEFNNGEVFAHRFDMKRNIEQKTDKVWKLFPKQDRSYIKAEKPVFKDKNIRFVIKPDTTYLRFTKPYTTDLIHSYKVVINDNTEQLYFSDFYKGYESSQIEELPLYKLKKGCYNIKIYAIDSLKNISDDYLEINDVKVVKYSKFKMVQAPDKHIARI